MKEQTTQKQETSEKRDTNQKPERLSSLLSLTPIILIAIFIIRLITSDSQSTQSSSRISSGMRTLTEIMPYIVSGAIVICSLICLSVTYVVRKESKQSAVFFVVIALILILFAWLAANSVSQVQIVPVSH